MIRAKVKCTEITQRQNDVMTHILTPVMGKENETWSKWTPSGKIELQITNPAAKFEFGKEYFVDFTEVEA